MWHALLVFIALFVLDFVWARYTIAIQRKAALAASHYAAMIIALAGFAQISYTGNPWLLIPATLGAAAGTWSAMKVES